MSIKTRLIISASLVVFLCAPASARIEGDEGGSAAYPTRRQEARRPAVRNISPSQFVAPGYNVVAPGYRRRR